MKDTYEAATLSLLVGTCTPERYRERVAAIRKAGEDDLLARLQDPASRAALRRVFARRR